jgi:regulator of protease activity HflC (stomatin/prohibitin superfamily)
MPYDNDEIPVWKFALWIGGGIAIIGTALLAGCPMYNVYSSRMDGEAELAKANYSKQVAVQTALAKNDAAKYEAEAEITRAGGVAKANQIIGDSLKNNEAYLRYLYVNNLEHTQNQVIYIPTEAGLPILEARDKR